MVKNYIKIALRNLRRKPGYTGINIVGLGLGMACCILAFLFVREELTYNRFHENIDDIYRVTARFQKTINFIVVPDPMVLAAVESIPEIVDGTRLWTSDLYVRHEGDILGESVLCTDPSFFSVFSFPMKWGVSALSDPQTVVLSLPIAHKYFGDKNPVGETMTLRLGDRFEDYRVVGVADEQPDNSSIEFDFVLPFENVYRVRESDMRDEWGSYGVSGFIQLHPEADTAQVYQKLLSLLDVHMGDSIREDGEELEDYAYQLHAFTDYHLGGQQEGGQGVKAAGNAAYVSLLAVIAGIVLLIACFNFMNLSIGQVSSRMREIGVRKVIGGHRRQLVQQFLLEALALSLFATLISVLFAHIMLPLFNGLTDKELVLAPFSDAALLIMLVGLTALAGSMAGGYPAFVLSNIPSIAAFRGRFKFGGNNLFTRSLVVLQFSSTIAFLIVTVFMSRQHDYLRDANLGFDDELVVMISTSLSPENPDHGEAFLGQMKQELVGKQGIRAVSGTSNAFTQGNSATMRTLEDGTQQLMFVYRVDNEYIPALDLNIMAGRNFSEEFPADAGDGIIVNEAFARVFDMDDPVGQIVPVSLVGIEAPRIIGVVEDYHFRSLHQNIEPVFLHQQDPYKYNHVLVKIAPENVSATIATLQSTWNTLRPDQPFEYQFMDEAIDAQYRTEEQWAQATTFASWLAIFIACLGLLGLTSLSMTKRTKEVGIRKILGATIPGLLNLLTREFLLLVGIANVIAWPIAYFALNRWLEGFPYRIEIGLDVFVGAGLVALCIALLTISYQSIRAALSNPVEALRYE